MIVKSLHHPAITISSSRTTIESEALPTMEEDIATSEATGAPNETSGSPKSLGLFVLPRELRDMIYRELVTSRNINILRASKTIHEEASAIVHKEAICRLNIDLSNKGTLLPHSNLSKSVATNIQHLDIQIVFPPIAQKHRPPVPLQDKESKYNPIFQFGGAEIVRKTCHVRFTICNAPYMRRNLTLALDCLQKLFGFEYLSVRVDIQSSKEFVNISIWHPFLALGIPDDLQGLLLAHIKVRLETTMGRASVREEPGSCSDDGQRLSAPCRYLEFHPRANLQANRHATLSKS